MKQHGAVKMVPIEDITDSTICHTSQLLPTETVNVPTVYELAYLGLSNRAIAGKLRIHRDEVTKHFSKTIDQARADRLVELLIAVNEQAMETDYSSKRRPDTDLQKFLIKRLDPEEKEPTIVINNGANYLDMMPTISLDELNDSEL